VIAAQAERVQRPTGAGFTDAVTFSWGDVAAASYGFARIGLGFGEAGAARASAVAVVFEDADLVASERAVEAPVDEPDWAALRAGALTAETAAPLERWRLAHDSAFDLHFEALSPPAELPAGGWEGYEQLCRVHGTVCLRDGERPVDALGQRGHAWAAPNWDALAAVRTVSVWLEPDRAVLMRSSRRAGSPGHEREDIAAVLVEPGAGGTTVTPVEDARVSTVHAGDGRQRRAGLELWIGDEDEYPLRAAGDAVCGTSLDLGGLRLDVAFFAWWMAGRVGAGRYDVLRRA
jgi:hypothetical protein